MPGRQFHFARKRADEVVTGDVVEPGHYIFGCKVERVFGQVVLRDPMLGRGYYFEPDEMVDVVVYTDEEGE